MGNVSTGEERVGGGSLVSLNYFLGLLEVTGPSVALEH